LSVCQEAQPISRKELRLGGEMRMMPEKPIHNMVGKCGLCEKPNDQ